MTTFVVVSNSEVDDKGKPLYWSNKDGWVDLAQALIENGLCTSPRT